MLVVGPNQNQFYLLSPKKKKILKPITTYHLKFVINIMNVTLFVFLWYSFFLRVDKTSQLCECVYIFFLFLLQVKILSSQNVLVILNTLSIMFNTLLSLLASHVIYMCLLVHILRTLFAVSEHTMVRITNRMVLITWDTS